MEFIFEFLIELIFEGVVEASKNHKVPKAIRYPLILLIVLLYIGVIFIVFFTGVLAYQRINRIYGILLIIIGCILLVYSIRKFIKVYKYKKH